VELAATPGYTRRPREGLPKQGCQLMARYVSWVINIGLLGLSCWFVAQSVTGVMEAWLTPLPMGDAPAALPADAGARPAADPQIILTRNLFNASILAPSTPIAALAEVLEATRLPLSLLGTAASDDPERSWAAIEDREKQQTLVLSNGDSVRNVAKVMRIERKRVVLDEGGALRELALDEPEGPAIASARPAGRANPPRRAPRAVPQAPPPAAAAPGAARTPAQLFQDARILPKYTEGQMVGVQVSSIKPGGIFEKMGLQDGDVITELNGVRIDSPEQSAKVLLEVTTKDSFSMKLDRASGVETVNVNLAP
jgi:general secretion pathway protein C